MEIVKCSNGHYYDRMFSETCPECALRERLESVSLDALEKPTVRLIWCPEGHSYDNTEKECPVCAGKRQEVVVPVRNLVTCPKGHRYDRSISEICPVCIAEECSGALDQNIRNDPFTDFSEPENTLAFTAIGSLSCQLWRKKGSFRVLLRNRLRNPPIILQEELVVPDQDALSAGREILEILSQHRSEGTFAGMKSDQGNCRLYFNARQLSCDYRWQQVYGGGNGPESCVQKVEEVLCRLFAQYQNRFGDTSAKEKSRLAEMECGRLNLVLGRGNEAGISLVQTPDGWKEKDYVLTLQSEIYYHFVSSVVLRESVMVPVDATRELLAWLGKCGVMEALVGANQRPNDGPCIDPGVATVFYLQNGDITFSYRDWNKTHTSEEYRLLEAAKDHMLEVYMRYRPEERK